MKKLGVGIVGLGYAGRKHFQAYESHPKVRIKAVCDLNKNRLQPFSEKVELCTQNYEEMLKRRDIEMISICTPNYLHAAQAIKALKADKHVLCEKPLAPSIENCEKIIEVLEKRKHLKFMVGQILRFSPLFRAIKRLYDEGELGEAFFAESDYLHNVEGRIKEWWEDKRNPHFALLGGGSHPVDLLRWIVGDIEEVYALSNHKVLSDFPYDDSIIMNFKFKNGCLGKVAIFLGCKRPYALNISIYGTKGTIINNKVFLSKIKELEDFITLPITILPEHPYFFKELSHFIDCIINDKSPLIDIREGAKTVATCIAAADSIKTGEPVKVRNNF